MLEALLAVETALAASDFAVAALLAAVAAVVLASSALLFAEATSATNPLPSLPTEDSNAVILSPRALFKALSSSCDTSPSPTIIGVTTPSTKPAYFN